MTDSVTCPFCQQTNPFNAEECQYCGGMLNSDTTIWKLTEDLGDIQRPALRAAEFVPNILYLYIASAQNQKPIQHSSKEATILGRASNKPLTAPFTLIDLTNYDALSLGVSRRHARVDHDDAGYSIEDLDSANGTWLNGNRLLAGQRYPLRSGDHLQLGELLMFIYYV